jgi:Flp pilus assembly protein TadD
MDRFATLRVHAIACALSLICAACAPDAPPAATNTRPALPAPQEMLAQVRAAGADANSLDVVPLRDPQVEDLRARAAKLETAGDAVGATQAIAQALALLPGDPELLQQSAEYALLQSDWLHAELFARQSYDHGPKLGSLCRRNWATLRFVLLARGDAPGAQNASQQIDACTVHPPVRM